MSVFAISKLLNLLITCLLSGKIHVGFSSIKLSENSQQTLTFNPVTGWSGAADTRETPGVSKESSKDISSSSDDVWNQNEIF